MYRATDRCWVCDGKCRPVGGDGPKNAKVMCVGERPGETENKLGIPFVGPAGKEYNETYLRRAGLDRETDVYTTNTVKCYAAGNRTPNEREIRGCAGHHLPLELERVEPRLVVLMGATACKLVDPAVQLELEHGIPREGSVFGWEGIVVPMYHPAAGLHDSGQMIPMLEDWERLGRYLAGDRSWQERAGQQRTEDYQLLETETEVLLALSRYGRKGKLKVAFDTERHGDRLWSVQWCAEPGVAYMVQVEEAGGVVARVTRKLNGDQTSAFDAFRQWACTNRGRIIGVLHNAPQDLDWLEKHGVYIDEFRDTMQEAYHLGNLPQGLKALGYRLLGIEMESYEDVVVPESREALLGWLDDAWQVAIQEFREYITKPYKKPKRDKGTGVVVTGREEIKASDFEKAVTRIIHHAHRNEGYDVWRKVEELEERFEAEMGWVKHEKGEPPEQGIGNVRLERAVQYACRDADVTYRVADELEKIRRKMTEGGGPWDVDVEDMDK